VQNGSGTLNSVSYANRTRQDSICGWMLSKGSMIELNACVDKQSKGSTIELNACVDKQGTRGKGVKICFGSAGGSDGIGYFQIQKRVVFLLREESFKETTARDTVGTDSDTTRGYIGRGYLRQSGHHCTGQKNRNH